MAYANTTNEYYYQNPYLGLGYLSMEDDEDKPKKSMITQLARKLFDKDTKILVKAGILDKDLEITGYGREFLLAKYLADNKTELAKEAAKLIKEKEEE